MVSAFGAFKFILLFAAGPRKIRKSAITCFEILNVSTERQHSINGDNRFFFFSSLKSKD